MTGLGLTSDVPDTQQLLAWLEGRPRERFGIVLTHVQELLSAPAEEQQGFLDLLDNILHVSSRTLSRTWLSGDACRRACGCYYVSAVDCLLTHFSCPIQQLQLNLKS
jgi:hypothetical protein